MIQDIAPRQLQNPFYPHLPKNNDIVLNFCPTGILIKEGEQLQFPTFEEYKNNTGNEKVVYLFSIGDTRFFMAEDQTEHQPEHQPEHTFAGYIFQNMQQIRGYAEKANILAASTGWHLYHWYRNNQFCGRCGKPTVHDTKERMLRCTCGNLIYPKIAPAVIVAVVNGDSILLTRYANRAYKKYALIAGFTEIGETAEETVRREVMEECGLKVKKIRYYKSQPWGFDSNLLLGFFCEVDGDITITRDADELSEAQWVSREDVPDYKEGLSLTHEMMQVFRAGKEYTF